MHELAVWAHHHRAAVEDQLVLTADGVHVDDPRADLPRAGGAHVEALEPLAHVIRGAVDADDQLRAGVAVERRAGAPRVLADGEPHVRAADVDDAASAAWLEVPPLVEDAVVRELDLVVPRLDPPSRSSAAALWLPCSLRSMKPVSTAHPPFVRLASSSRASRLSWTNSGAGRDPRAGSRIASSGKHTRSAPASVARWPTPEPIDVAPEVADGGVQLAERDPDHPDSLAAPADAVATRSRRGPGCRPPRRGRLRACRWRTIRPKSRWMSSRASSRLHVVPIGVVRSAVSPRRRVPKQWVLLAEALHGAGQSMRVVQDLVVEPPGRSVTRCVPRSSRAGGRARR
jgi:hypothetical protein